MIHSQPKRVIFVQQTAPYPSKKREKKNPKIFASVAQLVLSPKRRIPFQNNYLVCLFDRIISTDYRFYEKHMLAQIRLFSQRSFRDVFSLSPNRYNRFSLTCYQ